MKFKQFMRLDEIGEIENDNVDHVQLQPDLGNGGVRYVYNIDGREYRVRFGRHDFYVGDRPIRSVNIVFSGPNGVSLTHLGNSHAVYTEMLRGIKRYLEEYQPGALHFYGADSSMDLMYATFMKRFLSDRQGKDPQYVFIRVGSQDYLRKDIYESLPPEEKATVDTKIQQWNAQEAGYMKEREDRKKFHRANVQKLAGALGGFYIHNDREYSIIYKIDTQGCVETVRIEIDPGYDIDPYIAYSYMYPQDMKPERIIRRNELGKIGMDKLKRIIEALFNPRFRDISGSIPSDITDYLKNIYNKMVDPKDNRLNPPPPQKTANFAPGGGTNPTQINSPLRGPGRPQRDLLDRYRQYSAGQLARGDFDEV